MEDQKQYSNNVPPLGDTLEYTMKQKEATKNRQLGLNYIFMWPFSNTVNIIHHPPDFPAYISLTTLSITITKILKYRCTLTSLVYSFSYFKMYFHLHSMAIHIVEWR